MKLLPRFASIGSRIYGGLALTTGLLIVIAGFSITQLRQQDSGFAQTLEARMPLLLLSSELLSNIDELGQASRTALLVEGKDQARSALSIVVKRRGEIGEGLQKLNVLLRSDADESTKKLMSELEQRSSGFLVGMVKFTRLVEAEKMEGIKPLLLDQLEPQRAGLREMIFKLQQGQMRAVRDMREESRARTNRYENALIGLGILAILLSVATGWLIARSISGPLRQAMGVAAALAKGDLTQTIEVRGRDELGQLLGALGNSVSQLRGIVGGVRESTDAITTATKEIASGNADLSRRTEEQAASLEETASSMGELTNTVKQNAENAKQANQLAASASEVAVKGGTVVGQVVQTMSSINQSSKKIVDIISVIDGIAFQTNILALNAAVEAARAGEQGRGFAVVATEVRTLAQRSAAAAKEIKQLIGDSVHKVEDGTKLVDEAGKTMDEIVTAVKRVTDIMAEISAASQEQSSGIEQVNQAMTRMDEATQQNAALVEQATAAAESMHEQAQNLTQAVSVFKLAQGDERTLAPVEAGEPVASITRFPTRDKATAKGHPPVQRMPVAPRMRSRPK